jgi:hypothetical protein
MNAFCELRRRESSLASSVSCVMHVVSVHGILQGLYALFETASEAYLCRDDTYAWFSRKMGSKEKGMRLRRGYEAPRAVSLTLNVTHCASVCGLAVPLSCLIM